MDEANPTVPSSTLDLEVLHQSVVLAILMAIAHHVHLMGILGVVVGVSIGIIVVRGFIDTVAVVLKPAGLHKDTIL